MRGTHERCFSRCLRVFDQYTLGSRSALDIDRIAWQYSASFMMAGELAPLCGDIDPRRVCEVGRCSRRSAARLRKFVRWMNQLDGRYVLVRAVRLAVRESCGASARATGIIRHREHGQRQNDSRSSVPVPQARAVSNTTQLQHTLPHTRSAN